MNNVNSFKIPGIAEYQSSQKKRSVKIFRHYNLSTRRQLAEFDLCMIRIKNPQDYIGFVILVDCFTRFTWYSLIKSKSRVAVVAALKKITQKTGQFQTSSSDLELHSTKSFWSSVGTSYHSVPKSKHPAFAEVISKLSFIRIFQKFVHYFQVAQRTIKTRLYSALRQNHTTDWIRYLKICVDSINASPHKGMTSNCLWKTNDLSVRF